MSAEEPIGHLVFRVPVFRVTESESWEVPKEYTYLAPGDAELISHDIPASFHETLREELIEARYVEYGDWGPKELAETTRLHEHPMPAEPAAPTLGLDFFGSTVK
ncbi:hypothetical protein [Paenarthrobacter sp. C1]|uniref:hypothetical protein n=1 Tax=Paenarthrobacter sp. C1 TaxID=3400220 RepID=UPI003BF5C35F